jgi:hypothetical protein
MSGELLLFAVLAVILIAVVVAIRRYWDDQVELSADEEAYDKRVARLNERQANRFTDEQLTAPPSNDDAWQIILQRGRRALARRNRYGGDYTRRTRERRTRTKR